MVSYLELETWLHLNSERFKECMSWELWNLVQSLVHLSVNFMLCISICILKKKESN